jgi:hypothetical protein
MKIAILSESEADDTAIRILIDAALGVTTEPVAPPLLARGWPQIKDVLPAVLKGLHYNTIADGLIVIADSDDSPLHAAALEGPGGCHKECRICILREEIERTLGHVQSLEGRVPLKTAVGVASPAIEAWFLCGIDPSGTEAAWLQGGSTATGSDYRKMLKMKLYGEAPLSQSARIDRMKEEAGRLANDLSLLENHFPNGFGSLINKIRSW